MVDRSLLKLQFEVESVECDPISLAAGASWEATVNVVPRNK